MELALTRRLAYLAQPGLRQAVLRQGIAGAVAGFLVFLLLEPVRRAGGWDSNDLFDGIRHIYLPGVMFGAVITAVLVAAEELFSGSLLRLTGKAVAGALAGAVLGAGYSVIGQTFFWAIRDTVPGGSFLARSLGWALFGLGAGLSAGIAANSGKRAYHGCAGGLAGGFLAGVLFEMLSGVTGPGAPRLFTGFVILGTIVGIATALFEHLARTAWLTFLTGSREGQDVLLHKEQVVLGRDELVDVPLFGDLEVDRKHAVLVLEPQPRIELLSPGGALEVDGRSVTSADLYDGSEIRIGRHRLRFHQHEQRLSAGDGIVPPTALALNHLAGGRDNMNADPAAGPAMASMSFPEEQTVYGAYPQNGAPWNPSEPALLPPVMNVPLLLRVVFGPKTGTIVPLAGEAVTMGRDSGNTIPIKDAKISRYHARVDAIEGAWVLSDLGSTNGTWLNGLRIIRAGLEPGDRIELGGVTIRVEPLEAGAAWMPTR